MSKKFKYLLFYIFNLFFIYNCSSQEKLFPILSICPQGIQQLFNPIWESLGPDTDIPISTPNIGFVSSVAMSKKNPQLVFLASNTGAVYKTENFLDTLPKWKSCTDNLKLHGLGINDIAIDPNDDNKIYLATGFESAYGDKYGFGVLKSNDKGTTWKTIGPGLLKNNNLSLKLKIDNINSNFIWLAQNDKLLKYNTIKNIWDTLFTLPNSKGLDPYHPGSNCRKIVDIEQNLLNPNCWVISTDYNGSKKEDEHSLVYITRDNGVNWKKLILPSKYKSDKIVVSCSKKEANKFYLTGTYFDEIKKTNLNFIISLEENKDSWDFINEISISGTGYYRQELEFSELSNSIYIGGYYVNYSYDNGIKFFQNSKNVHVDCRSLSVYKINDSTEYLVSGNDGGIVISTDFGKTWINKNGTGLNIKQFHAIGVANATTNLVAGGTQDNDINIFDGKWSAPQLTNDGAETIIDKLDNKYIYAQPFCCDPSQLKVRKYQKLQQQWKVIESISPPEHIGNSLRPFKQFDDGSIIIAYHDIWKSERGKLKWKKISSFSENFNVNKNNAIKDVAIDDEDTNKIVAIFEGPSWSDELNESYLFIKKKNSQNWIDLTQNLPAVVPRWLALSCVEIDKNNNNILYVGTTEIMTNDSIQYPYNGKMKLIRSLNNGYTWEDYSNNLPPFKINRILSQKGVNGSLYLATDVGVFYTNNEIYESNGWICLNENMPVSIATDLEINYCEGKLYCSTYGYGIWRTDIFITDKSNKSYYEMKGKQEFIGNKVFEKSIKINKKSRMILKNGTFSMPYNSEIKLERGATLILDNAILLNQCEKKWNGVFKEKKSKIILSNNSKIIIN